MAQKQNRKQQKLYSSLEQEPCVPIIHASFPGTGQDRNKTNRWSTTCRVLPKLTTQVPHPRSGRASGVQHATQTTTTKETGRGLGTREALRKRKAGQPRGFWQRGSGLSAARAFCGPLTCQRPRTPEAEQANPSDSSCPRLTVHSGSGCWGQSHCTAARVYLPCTSLTWV